MNQWRATMAPVRPAVVLQGPNVRIILHILTSCEASVVAIRDVKNIVIRCSDCA
jgi:hypothetical protein